MFYSTILICDFGEEYLVCSWFDGKSGFIDLNSSKHKIVFTALRKISLYLFKKYTISFVMTTEKMAQNV